MAASPIVPTRGSMPAGIAVVDTNVLLDWLVFDDPRVAPLATAIESGKLDWVATAAMHDELSAVAAQGVGARWPIDADRVFRAWDRHVHMRAHRTFVFATPRCSDRADQMFVDLAVLEAASGSVVWLLTRDRALLRLTRPLARCGVQVAPPERCIGWLRPNVDPLGARDREASLGA